MITRNFHRIDVRRTDLEHHLLNFYNGVVDLVQPTQTTTTLSSSSSSSLSVSTSASNPNPNPNNQRLSYNLLVVFCLLFGYNLVNNDPQWPTTSDSNFNLHQTQPNGQPSKHVAHILSQLRRVIDEKSFAERIRIIYFLLIMFMSHGHSQHEANFGGEDRYGFFFSEDTNEIQRTFLDLLNSELDYQDVNNGETRISLLLILDQFI